MVNEAKEHAEEDKKKRSLVDVRNNADGLVYSTEKLMKEVGSKAPEDMKKNIEEQVKVLQKSLESDNADEIKKETEKLQNLQSELSQKLYAQAGAAGAGPGAGPGGPGAGAQGGPGAGAAGGKEADSKKKGNGEEDVIDAEFEAKDDEKK